LNQKENDILLIKAFKEGNPKAFDTLFHKHHKRLYAFLFHVLNSKEDTEEIVQETFIKIWEKREEFLEGYPFEPFLFKIAKNAFLKLNRRKINHQLFEEYPSLLFEISSRNTDDHIIFKETADIVNLIVNDLPPKRKEIFLLRRIEGYTRQEVANQLGISVITVDSQLLKANKHLKDGLKKYGILMIIPFFS